MALNLDVLKEITATALKADGVRTFRDESGRTVFVKPDGSQIEFKPSPLPHYNLLSTVEDVVQVFHKYPNSTIWVSDKEITVEHNDATRQEGRSVLNYKKAPAMRYIETAEDEISSFKPEKFELIAKLYFLATAGFIARLRKLQWKNSVGSNAELSNANKSMSISQINKVLDEAGNPFEDVILPVQTPIFVVPFKTTPVEIKLNLVANAETCLISFAPFPGDVAELTRQAVAEIYADVLSQLTNAEQERVYMGEAKTIS